MDERLEKALEFSNFMVTLNNQRRLLEEKYHEDLLYFYNGSQFTVTKELITFAGLLVSEGQDADVVITDDNGTPAMIADLEEFYSSIVDVYFSASNAYYQAYLELKKSRSVEKLTSYDKE